MIKGRHICILDENPFQPGFYNLLSMSMRNFIQYQGVERTMFLWPLFRIFEKTNISFYCFVVATFDLEHDAGAMFHLP